MERTRRSPQPAPLGAWREDAAGAWINTNHDGWRIERDGAMVVLIRPTGTRSVERRRFRDVRSAVFYAATVLGP